LLPVETKRRGAYYGKRPLVAVNAGYSDRLDSLADTHFVS